MLSTGQYFAFRKTLYRQYRDYIRNVLTYTASGIDADDLAKCIRMGEESDKYRQLQSFLDQIKENSELHFLYIVIPLNTAERDNMRNVIAGATKFEYEYESDELVKLDELTGDSYAPKTAEKYLRAYESGQLSFFEERSEWGDDYTGLLPLFDSAGNKVAALCMDVEIAHIHTQLAAQTLSTILVIALLGTLFAVIFIVWTDSNITWPIRQLERSVVQLAVRSHGQRNPDALVLRVPPIHTDNEIESLAQAIGQMSEDMRDYVKSILDTERELARMNVIAHKDALTHVKNKTAYERCSEELQERIGREKLEFAILMADVNRLKQINDAFGHERGDQYLKNCCAILCEVFSRSPIFRIGGDEFVAVLTGEDYLERKLLLRRARDVFQAAEELPEAEPWERASVSLGLAEYRERRDKRVKDVFERADRLMYREKDNRKGENGNG